MMKPYIIEYDHDDRCEEVNDDLIDMVHNCHNVITLIDDLGINHWLCEEKSVFVKHMQRLRSLVIDGAFALPPDDYEAWQYAPATADEARIVPFIDDMINQIKNMDHDLDRLTDEKAELEGCESEWWSACGVLRLEIRTILLDLHAVANRVLNKVDGVKFHGT